MRSTLGGAPVDAVLGAVAAQDGARPGQETLGVDVLARGAVVHGGDGEAAAGGQQQGESAAQAVTDDTDPAGAVVPVS
jgi:hypothetical protein